MLARALVVAVVLALGASASATAAPHSVRACALRVTIVDVPGGAVTGVVHRGDLLFVLNGRARARWWRVQTTFGTRGWLHRTALCGPPR